MVRGGIGIGSRIGEGVGGSAGTGGVVGFEGRTRPSAALNSVLCGALALVASVVALALGAGGTGGGGGCGSAEVAGVESGG